VRRCEIIDFRPVLHSVNHSKHWMAKMVWRNISHLLRERCVATAQYHTVGDLEAVRPRRGPASPFTEVVIVLHRCASYRSRSGRPAIQVRELHLVLPNVCRSLGLRQPDSVLRRKPPPESVGWQAKAPAPHALRVLRQQGGTDASVCQPVVGTHTKVQHLAICTVNPGDWITEIWADRGSPGVPAYRYFGAGPRTTWTNASG
jgi:hypothetical protein